MKTFITVHDTLPEAEAALVDDGLDSANASAAPLDDVVPLLQDRGVLRSDYEGTTLRDNLGLPIPVQREHVTAR